MKKRVRQRRERRRREDIDIDRRKKVDFQGVFLEGLVWDWCKGDGEDVGMVLGYL